MAKGRYEACRCHKYSLDAVKVCRGFLGDYECLQDVEMLREPNKRGTHSSVAQPCCLITCISEIGNRRGADNVT